MEDYIYIMIAVVWIAYSFYTSYQKAQKQKQGKTSIPGNAGPVPAPKPYMPERDILHELLGEPEPKEVIPSGKTYVPEWQEAAPEKKVTEAESMEEIIDDIKTEKRTLVTFQPEAETTSSESVSQEQESGTETSFNLRNAVIYSEILNRKYV